MELRFRPDGSFRVLQMADVQDGPLVSPDTIRLITSAIQQADPDLVVFTGDQIRGYDPVYINTFRSRRNSEPGSDVRALTKIEATLRSLPEKLSDLGLLGVNQHAEDDQSADAQHSDTVRPDTRFSDTQHTDTQHTDDQHLAAQYMDETRDKVRATMAAFLQPLVDANIPFAATYGNHDFQCGVLAEEQDDMYREFKGCLNPRLTQRNKLAKEAGTFALPIRSSVGKRIAMSVVMVNSGDYASDDRKQTDTVEQQEYAKDTRSWDLADSDGYGNPSLEALDWLGTVQQTLGRMNRDRKPVPTIAFQHIPPQEFYDCLKEVPAWTPNAVEGSRTFAGHCYLLNEDLCRPGSILGEAIACADTNCGEVDLLRKAGGFFALFCGHDHKNSFVAHAHDLDLGYAPTCGFTSYGPKSRMRGIRLFEFKETNPQDYTTELLTWGNLIGRYSSNEVNVFIQDHTVADAIGIRNELRRPRVFAFVAVTLSLTCIAIVRGIVHAVRKYGHTGKRSDTKKGRHSK